MKLDKLYEQKPVYEGIISALQDAASDEVYLSPEVFMPVLRKALADYDKAISIDGRLAEAYYNRGMVRVFAGNVEQGVADLSKAGELGLVDAYVAIKKYGNKKGK